MVFTVNLTNRAEKAFKASEPKFKAKLRILLDSLSHSFHPPGYDIQKMKGHKAIYRIRLGPARVLYQVNLSQKLVTILSIDSRGHAYQRY